MKNATVLFILLFPVFGNTTHRHCDRPITFRKVLSSSTRWVSNLCAQEKPLKLVNGNFPFSFGTYFANYWEGSYNREAEVIEIVKYTTYDCWGRIIDQETNNENTQFVITFALTNANLSETATWADIKAPMTDIEAQLAFKK